MAGMLIVLIDNGMIREGAPNIGGSFAIFSDLSTRKGLML